MEWLLLSLVAAQMLLVHSIPSLMLGMIFFVILSALFIFFSSSNIWASLILSLGILGGLSVLLCFTFSMFDKSLYWVKPKSKGKKVFILVFLFLLTKTSDEVVFNENISLAEENYSVSTVLSDLSSVHLLSFLLLLVILFAFLYVIEGVLK